MSNRVENLPVAFYTVSISGKSDNANAKGLDAEIEANKGAEEGAIRSLVNIIPKVYSKPITSLGAKVRNHFEKNGIRLGKTVYGIPLTILPKFKAELDVLRQEHALHVSKLVEVAESGVLLDLVTKQAGDVASQVVDKVPDADDIRNGFGIDIRVAVDFNDTKISQAMAILSDDVKNQLRAEVEASAKKDKDDQINNVNGKIINAVKLLIKDINDRCAKGEKGTQWKTMIDKIKHIVEVLPAYNVLANPELDALIKSVNDKFGKLDQDLLKEDDNARKEMIEDANEIKSTFAKLF